MKTPARALAVVVLLLLGVLVAVPRSGRAATVVTVTTTADGGAGSLRQAIINANNNLGDDTILLPAGTYTLTLNGSGEDLGATGDLDVKNASAMDSGNLVIQGEGANSTIIQWAAANRNDRILDVAPLSPTSQTSLVLNDVTLRNGLAPAGTFGGGMRVFTNMTAQFCVFDLNGGGGIFADGGNASAVSSTFTTNTGSGMASGQVDGGASPGVGAIQCTFSGNTAANGGGILVGKGSASITQCTISGNNAPGGAGGGVNVGAGLTATLNNTIISGNTAATGPEISGTVVSQGTNLIRDGTGGSGFIATDKVGTAGSPINTRLVALADNGGPALTFALQLFPNRSPAIDAGNQGVGTQSTDQRRVSRPDGGLATAPPPGTNLSIDIGAFEAVAPTDLVAEPLSATSIDLTFTSNSASQDQFQVERKKGFGVFVPAVQKAWMPSDGSVVRVTDTGLTANTRYTYRVRSAGPGGYSNLVSANTVPEPPAAPTGLTARATSTTNVALSYADNSNSEADFEIVRSTDGTNFSTLVIRGADLTTYNDNTVTAGNSYWYRVRARNIGGNSPFSDTAEADTPLLSPSGLSATALSATSVKVQWTDTNGSEGGYEVQRSVNNSLYTTVGTVGANATQATDASAEPNTPYFYRVRAFNAAGSGPTSGAVSVTTPGTPPAPSGVILTPSLQNRVRIDWTDNSGTETGFEIQRSFTNTLWVTVGTTSANVVTAQDDSVEPDTTYFYRVRAVNQFGVSSSGSVSVTTPDGLPNAPTGLSATAVSATQINLAWTDNAAGDTGFEVQSRGTAAGLNEPWTTIGITDPNANTATDLGLNPSTGYSYRVRALNAFGGSAWSNAATATTLPPGSSGISLKAAAAKPGKIRLTWTAKSRKGGVFTIERKDGVASDPARFSPIGSVRVGAGKWVDVAVKGGARYTYRLRRQAALSNAATARAPNR